MGVWERERTGKGKRGGEREEDGKKGKEGDPQG